MEERRLRSILRSVAGKSTAKTILLALSIFVLLSFQIVAVAGMTEGELETAIDALRSKGYDLFSNAIETSDLQYDLLDSGESFTIFAPAGGSLSSLDLASQASDYIQTLRFHVSPRRFTFSDLRSLSMSQVPYVDSLLHNHALYVAINNITQTNSDSMIVDGVQISVPDLYLGPSIAVHGLDGILAIRFQVRPIISPPAMSPLVFPTKQDFTAAASSPAPGTVNSSFDKRGKHHERRRRKKRRGKKANDENQDQ
ncbi:hypothetical protein NE237_018010 [Protea cynaroides]|uniref:FAS1 domain-containing protein n=1 Tax=Protea cynaroides TaxID=273540 RepID=A0A9Q0K931_9MAGN|nr:hypothetical protein NE237_018010 [Protea cynaroides]